MGLVELASGLKMYGIVQTDPKRIRIGDEVHAVFDAVTSDVTMVRWRPV